jgi:hypothetical protein
VRFSPCEEGAGRIGIGGPPPKKKSSGGVLRIQRMFDSLWNRGNKFRMRIPKFFLHLSSLALGCIPVRAQDPGAGKQFLQNHNFEAH